MPVPFAVRREAGHGDEVAEVHVAGLRIITMSRSSLLRVLLASSQFELSPQPGSTAAVRTATPQSHDFPCIVLSPVEAKRPTNSFDRSCGLTEG